MYKIVCLKWGVKYGSEYVNRLYNGIKRNCQLPFELHCFTDNEIGINSEVVTHELPYSADIDSWWNKIWLFSDDLPFHKNERILYLDLDTLITGNIDALLSNNGEDFIMLRDFYWGIAKSATPSASGVMAWNAGEFTQIWEKFIKNPEESMASVSPHGDQHFISGCLGHRVRYWQDLFPEQVVSFKVHCREGLPPNAKIICFHGEPSIPDAATHSWSSWKFKGEPQPWVWDYWC